MFPLKTLILAAVFAVVLGPHVNACPAHNHMQTASTATGNAESGAQVSKPAESVEAQAEKAQPAELAAANQAASPPAN